MTQRTKAGLQTNLNADLADNSTGDISAADVRGNLIDFTDSVPFLSTADNTLSGSFSGSFQGDGSNLTGITVTTADTASNTPNALTTASVSSNVITFTKGDTSTFNITVDTGSAGGSAFPYTGSADITGSLTVEGPTVLSGSLEVSGSVTIGRLNGAGLDLGVYSINTASFQIDYLDMEVYSDTTIDAYSFGSTVSNFEIKNTAQYGGTKGYIKLNAGDLLITGSAVYIKPSSLPTTEPSDSGQLWLSGSAGNSKYLMVRD